MLYERMYSSTTQVNNVVSLFKLRLGTGTGQKDRKVLEETDACVVGNLNFYHGFSRRAKVIVHHEKKLRAYYGIF